VNDHTRADCFPGEVGVCGQVSASPILRLIRGRPDVLRPERQAPRGPSRAHLTGPGQAERKSSAFSHNELGWSSALAPGATKESLRPAFGTCQDLVVGNCIRPRGLRPRKSPAQKGFFISSTSARRASVASGWPAQPNRGGRRAVRKLADSRRIHGGKETHARGTVWLAHVRRSRLLPRGRLQHRRRPGGAVQGRGLRRRKEGLLVADYTAWGWFLFIVGLLQLAAGIGIFKGRGWGRLLGVALAALSAMLHIAFLVAFLAFGLITIALSVLVIYGLIVPDQRSA
jgi:hypothetical protein